MSPSFKTAQGSDDSDNSDDLLSNSGSEPDFESEPEIISSSPNIFAKQNKTKSPQKEFKTPISNSQVAKNHNNLLPFKNKFNSPYSIELTEEIESRLNMTSSTESIETNMFRCFSESPSGVMKEWREGHQKSAFNYLLIDPRVTQNLPARAKTIQSQNEIFHTFIKSIFYVGKGSRARPYAHLHDTLRVWKGIEKNNQNYPTNNKPLTKVIFKKK
jgi:hypothetical protein